MYYSPILFSKISDLNLTQFHNCHIDMDYLNSKERLIIYCLHSIDYLYKLCPFLDNVKKPFILISAMEDQSFPAEIDGNLILKITQNVFFKHWFTINKTIPDNEQFTSIPYGLDFWTLTTRSYFGENVQSFEEQNDCLQCIINNSVHYSQRIPKIYGNFHFHFNDDRHNQDRRKLLNIIPRDIIFYEPKIIPRSESYKNMSKYSFVVSPFGNGFDCIRTFEALSLGCIVIMKKSFLDIIYEELPVLLVDEWSDIDEALLQKTILEFKDKQFNYDKLKMDYWIEVVKSKF